MVLQIYNEILKAHVPPGCFDDKADLKKKTLDKYFSFVSIQLYY